MASVKRSYKIGADLDDAMTILATRLGYPSGASFLKGLLRHACLTQASHKTSLPWAHYPLEKQDVLDAALLARVKAEKRMTSAEAAQMTFDQIIGSGFDR